MNTTVHDFPTRVGQRLVSADNSQPVRVGAFSMTYAQKLRDRRWRELRDQVVARDGHKCRDCGKANGLQVHHSFYERGNPWETSPELLITVCASCHDDRECCEEVLRRELSRLMVKLTKSELDAKAEAAAVGGIKKGLRA